MLNIVPRRERRRLGNKVHIEGRARPVQVAGDLRPRDTVADPKPSQAVGLGEGARYHDIVSLFDQGNQVGALWVLYILEIGLVKNRKHMRRNLFEEARDLALGDESPGWVVWVGDKDKPRRR